MPTALIPFLLSLALLIVPLTTQAGDANDFVAANPAKQAKLLESWAAHPDAALSGPRPSHDLHLTPPRPT